MMEHIELEKREVFVYHDEDGNAVRVGHKLINSGDLVFGYMYTEYKRKEVGVGGS